MSAEPDAEYGTPQECMDEQWLDLPATYVDCWQGGLLNEGSILRLTFGHGDPKGYATFTQALAMPAGMARQMVRRLVKALEMDQHDLFGPERPK
jgi:hypothetical protein